MSDELLRPIIGIEHRTAQEVFDIMCSRIRLNSPISAALASLTAERDRLRGALADALDEIVDLVEADIGREVRNGDLPPRYHRARAALEGTAPSETGRVSDEADRIKAEVVKLANEWSWDKKSRSYSERLREIISPRTSLNGGQHE